LTIDGLEIEVRFKRMKTVRLHIVPPDGRVWVSAPLGIALRDVERIVAARLPFIREKQAWMQAQARSAPADPLERGWHQLLGRRLPLVIDPDPDAVPGVRLVDDRLMVAGEASRDAAVLQASLDQIQREELQRTLADLMPVWEERLGRRASWWGIRAMRTRWGSCSHRTGRIRFSLNLGAQHPRQIEYLVLHELAHLFVPNHGPDFTALMDHHMPDWRIRKRALKAIDEMEGNS
jgi:predicted metal-dependent hydrolase